MKCPTLFHKRNKKSISNCRLQEFLPGMQSINCQCISAGKAVEVCMTNALFFILCATEGIECVKTLIENYCNNSECIQLQ